MNLNVVLTEEELVLGHALKWYLLATFNAKPALLLMGFDEANLRTLISRQALLHDSYNIIKSNGFSKISNVCSLNWVLFFLHFCFSKRRKVEFWMVMELTELSLAPTVCVVDKSSGGNGSLSESENNPSRKRKLFSDQILFKSGLDAAIHQPSVDLQLKNPLPLDWEQCLDLQVISLSLTLPLSSQICLYEIQS